jgi:hypothetical protein
MFSAFFGNWSLVSCSQQSSTEYLVMYIYLFQGVSSLYLLLVQLVCCRHCPSLPCTYFFCNCFYKRLSHIHVCSHMHIRLYTHTHTHTHHLSHPLWVNKAFIFPYNIFDSLTLWLLKVRLLHCLKLLGTNHPVAQYHIP